MSEALIAVCLKGSYLSLLKLEERVGNGGVISTHGPAHYYVPRPLAH
jgi:hypothetical protein